MTSCMVDALVFAHLERTAHMTGKSVEDLMLSASASTPLTEEDVVGLEARYKALGGS